jgi:hypothetical protein
LLARVGGINTATGALLGASTLTAFAIAAPHSNLLAQLQYILTGLAAVSVGRDPNGIAGRFSDVIEQFRATQKPKPAIGTEAGTPAAAFIAEEGETLVGAGH